MTQRFDRVQRSPRLSAGMARLLYVSAFGVLLAGLYAFLNRQPASALPVFERLLPGLHRLNYDLKLPLLAPLPVATWLIDVGQQSWVLVDAGINMPKNQQAVIEGVRKTLSPDSLKLILGEQLWEDNSISDMPLYRSARALSIASTRQLSMPVVTPAVTHGHLDHTGSLAQLLDIYPSTKVAYHEREALYMSGGGSYRNLQGDHMSHEILKYVIPRVNSTVVPKDREIILLGQSGDVSDFVKPSGWLPKSFLEYHLVPGHTPGQLAILHKPSGSLLTAETCMNAPSTWPWSQSGPNEVSMPLKFGTYSWQLAKESLQNHFSQSEFYLKCSGHHG